MKVNLAYGRGYLPVEFPDQGTVVIQPSHTPGLKDEPAAVRQALENPIGAPPLRDWLKPDSRVCVLFTDITRATPNKRLIPWLLDEMSSVAKERIVLLNELGTHRPNTAEELSRMLTPHVTAQYRILNHDAADNANLAQVGTTWDGTPALLNRHFLEADVRIVTGFIEPHFFAGFSGGPKGIMPGIAGLDTVMSNHGLGNINSPKATFGVTEGNPVWEEMRDVALRAGPCFLLNVSLNEQRHITGVFAGDLIEAHRVGCEFVRRSAMQAFDAPFDVVVTTNSGYPLDLNLYQGVKGMSAGARLVKPGGTLILACECSEGVPTGSSFDRILRKSRNPAEILALLAAPGFREPEQWQAQIQALTQKKARVLLYSSLSEDLVRAAHLEVCRHISGTVQDLMKAKANGQRVVVLPQGPLTIPYLV
jgi:lactate racemase